MKYIETLTEAVAIRSVSARPQYREECQHMIDWTQARMEALGIACEQVDIGMQTLPDNSSLKLPNVLMASLKTVSNLNSRITYCSPHNYYSHNIYSLSASLFSELTRVTCFFACAILSLPNHTPSLNCLISHHLSHIHTHTHKPYNALSFILAASTYCQE
jgi:hypothetical protein